MCKLKRSNFLKTNFKQKRYYTTYIPTHIEMEQATQMTKNLNQCNFVNTAYNSLKILKQNESDSRQPKRIRGYHFTQAYPIEFQNPRLILLSQDVANTIGWDTKEILKDHNLMHQQIDADDQKCLVGNKVPEKSQPLAHCYCGHQFGNFAGQLGDGRAILLGDVLYNGDRTELQYKGSGKTNFSRHADGYAVLRSSIREFLASEYMFNIGIPTTRALSLSTTDSQCDRDPQYNGNVIKEKCTVVVRAAESFQRFGSFEVCEPAIETGRDSPNVNMDDPILTDLLEFTLDNHYSEIRKKLNPQKSKDLKNQEYFEMMKEVMKKTAEVIALWQCSGFCHGVMNTDNMSILGLTIDYGPFGFMEFYDEYHVCNASDEWGRYGYKAQPKMGEFDLQKLYNTLKRVLDEKTHNEQLDYHKKNYWNVYKKAYYGKMAKKLGILTFDDMSEDQMKRVHLLVEQLFYNVMNYCRTDITLMFKALENFDLDHKDEIQNRGCTENIINEMVELSPNLQHYRNTLLPKQNLMVGRDANQKLQVIKKLMSTPQEKMNVAMALGFMPEEYFQNILDNEQILKEVMVSGESDCKLAVTTKDKFKEKWNSWFESYSAILRTDQQNYQEKMTVSWNESRTKTMRGNNPWFQQRNYLIQDAIKLAESGDFTEVEKLYEQSLNPYDHEFYVDASTGKLKESVKKYCSTQPEWAGKLVLSCSS